MPQPTISSFFLSKNSKPKTESTSINSNSSSASGNATKKTAKSKSGIEKPVIDKTKLKVSPSIKKEKSPMVIKENSPTVVKEKSPTVIKEKSPTAVKEKSPMIVKENSPSMTKLPKSTTPKQVSLLNKEEKVLSVEEEEPKESNSPQKKSNAPKKRKHVLQSDSESSDSAEKLPKKQKINLNNFFKPKTENESKSKTENEAESKTENEAESKTENESVINPSDYLPSKSAYKVVKDACWKEEEPVPYLAIARTFGEIEKTSGRLDKINTFTNFLKSVIRLTPKDLISCLYLCMNQVAPQYKGIELNIGESIVVGALSGATGTSMQNLKLKSKTIGDYGTIAYELGNTQQFLIPQKPLTVNMVFKKFLEVANLSGKSCTSEKKKIIQNLLLVGKSIERKYLVRGLTGKLGIQFGEQSVLAALGNAVATSKSDMARADAGAIVKKAFCECPNYDLIVEKLLEVGVNKLGDYCTVVPGVPVKPMLAHPSKGMTEVLKRFEVCGDFTSEYKYDGERAQIHAWYDDDEEGKLHVNVFSRNQEDNTQKYPDIISMMKRNLSILPNVKSCIIDTEAVAWDKDLQCIRPFQELSTRKRKDVKEEDIKIQVCVYSFDLIYFNGKSLTEKSFRKRRNILRNNFKEVTGEFMFATSLDSTDTEDINDFLEQSIKDKCEGLMLKTLDAKATYEISKRSRQWLKLKKDYLESIGDTVDLVVIGAYHGMGKRANKFGAYLMACYEKENDRYQAICKLGTGFKDSDLDNFNTELSEHIIKKVSPDYLISPNVRPDVWFAPKVVWEIKAADLSISPEYRAAVGLVDKDKGISLRFPRFVRVREDKKPENATDARQIATLYKSQDNINLKDDMEDDEFY